MLIGWLTATLASIAGLYVSYESDLPTGASIVCALGAALLLVLISSGFFLKRNSSLEAKRSRPEPTKVE
jgi:ABC-type Mn2+/Zn2+ transport system permease subunit